MFASIVFCLLVLLLERTVSAVSLAYTADLAKRTFGRVHFEHSQNVQISPDPQSLIVDTGTITALSNEWDNIHKELTSGFKFVDGKRQFELWIHHPIDSIWPTRYHLRDIEMPDTQLSFGIVVFTIDKHQIPFYSGS
ncbi:uncharacterized protein L969DRAFT_75887 [Mixia osmundae IAM 14324]|uniref:Uncharacterized protein n=1 Tax=Mixia osmundae (strain CBS 9802 / IAM 14324 / JCM 22182 / KY 12970) TaxID=764103 RepID=G7E6Z4_MIXOS|nr:uncharacterized protein L969DRAFT_75887 [Mixia osmundae IAM 14324]KEI39013.1 hypothetical protein L969DRAFT_75887 [Mixia osmundae IAM 14324]GAA98604.1 hypothetical protein E5Q_05291 [Mixia osmundae IAM 14324]